MRVAELERLLADKDRQARHDYKPPAPPRDPETIERCAQVAWNEIEDNELADYIADAIRKLKEEK